MAEVQDGEKERSGNQGERDGELERPADRGARSVQHLPALEVNLSAPWSGPPGTAHGCQVQCVTYRGEAPAEEVTRVVEERTRVHETWIRENERTKRLALIIGAVLFVAGCLVIVFSPSGREAVASIVGAAMLVVAAGTVGYRRVWARGPLVSVGAGDADPAAENHAAKVEHILRARRPHA